MIRTRILVLCVLCAGPAAGCKKPLTDDAAVKALEDDDPTFWEWNGDRVAMMQAAEDEDTNEDLTDEPGADDTTEATDTATSTATATATQVAQGDGTNNNGDAGLGVGLRLVDTDTVTGGGDGTQQTADNGVKPARAEDDPDPNDPPAEVCAETSGNLEDGDIEGADCNPVSLDEFGGPNMAALALKGKGLGLANTMSRTWPRGQVIYTFAPGFASQTQVQAAMRAWEAVSPVRFQQRTSQAGYVVIGGSQSGCFATLGYTGRRQVVNLGTGCLRQGTIMHELGHAMGLHHEQKRSDASQFIRINFANIIPENRHNFEAAGVAHGQYDYGSVMHYGRMAFSRNGQPTIEPTQPGVTIGQRDGPSQGDIAAINTLYQGANPTQPGGCAGAWNHQWEPRFAHNADNSCRNPRQYCACWKNRAGNCAIYAPGSTSPLGPAVRADAGGTCDQACDQAVERTFSQVVNRCNREVILLNASRKIEAYRFEGNP